MTKCLGCSSERSMTQHTDKGTDISVYKNDARSLSQNIFALSAHRANVRKWTPITRRLGSRFTVSACIGQDR